MATPDIDLLLSDTEGRLERVRVLYDLYFQGIERIPPSVPRKEFERRMDLLRRTRFPNTALRFRYQNLLQRFQLLRAQWQRTLRSIEEGTYRRDVNRARARMSLGVRPQVNPSLQPDSLAGDAISGAANERNQVHEQTSQSANDPLQALHAAYLQAKGGRGPSLDVFRQYIDALTPKVQAKFGNKPVTFRIVTQDGKVGIKPVVVDARAQRIESPGRGTPR